ncbi:MAG: Fe-S cluster assembly ATPase SufC [Candidatus Electryonea clarkiae]|nr:Fe-S cluster assembly ATPase SufC [Candidatus Electryonea clarkiae]MDP8285312.1 Fe-S cluster assembly ATPase SufC [Candidatus Electryonea clarkiae]
MGKINSLFSIKDLHVEVEGIEVVKGVSLEIFPGEKHTIMGPNGSGKSSLANALAGHPEYTVTSGEAWLDGNNLLELNVTDRSKTGLFLAFQYPHAVPGVSVSNFLRSAVKAHRGDSDDVLRGFRKEMGKTFEFLEMDKSFATRYVNDGFSGGEKKRFEILQMLMLEPKMAILDETDSGLDIDALRIVSKGINHVLNENNAALIVTHYQRILNYVKPDYVHVMMDGRIVRSGDHKLALELEEHGYDWLKAESVESMEN